MLTVLTTLTTQILTMNVSKSISKLILLTGYIKNPQKPSDSTQREVNCTLISSLSSLHSKEHRAKALKEFSTASEIYSSRFAFNAKVKRSTQLNSMLGAVAL